MAAPETKAEKRRSKQKKTFAFGGATSTERAVLRLLESGVNTPAQIAKRRKTTIRAAQMVLKRLREKGLIVHRSAIYATRSPEGGVVGGDTPPLCEDTPPKTEPSVPVETGPVRLHGQHIVADVLGESPAFRKRIGSMLEVSGSLVVVHARKIEIHARRSFRAPTLDRAVAASMDYWRRFLVRLEDRLGCVLVRDSALNVRVVRQHVADELNGVARSVSDKGERLKIRATDDAKVWAETDRSLNFDELDFIHPATATDDFRTVVERHLNAWRDAPDCMTNAELQAALSQLVKIVSRTETGIYGRIKEADMDDRTTPDYVG